MRCKGEKMDFAKELKSNFNKTLTGNGDVTYKSSLNKNLDLFYKSGGIRGNNYYGDKPKYDDYLTLFLDAYDEDPVLAIKNLFNIRDFRHSGKGERGLFRTLIVGLDEKNPELLAKLVESGQIENLGRWDDLVYVYDKVSRQDLKSIVANHIKIQINNDLISYANNEPISLISKWLPTNTRNKESYKIAKSLAKSIGFKNFSSYRKTLSKLKAYLNILETNMTTKSYDKIEYSKVPSRAFQKNIASFYRNDEDGITKFFEDVKDGKESVKVGAITPDEVVSKAFSLMFGNIDYYGYNRPKPVDAYSGEAASVVETWKEFVANTKDVGNTLVMADVSGSMNGKPMEVSVALATLFAQSMTGAFHNMYMSFSSSPDIITLSDNANLFQNLYTVLKTEWGWSTSIDNAFRAVLDTATGSNASQEDIPERIVIISDMQFNESVEDTPHVNRWKEKFSEYGYTLPTVVYWNVSTSTGVPARSDEENVALISGFTPATLNAVLSAKDVSPKAVMIEALSAEEYGFVDNI